MALPPPRRGAPLSAVVGCGPLTIEPRSTPRRASGAAGTRRSIARGSPRTRGPTVSRTGGSRTAGCSASSPDRASGCARSICSPGASAVGRRILPDASDRGRVGRRSNGERRGLPPRSGRRARRSQADESGARGARAGRRIPRAPRRRRAGTLRTFEEPVAGAGRNQWAMTAERDVADFARLEGVVEDGAGFGEGGPRPVDLELVGARYDGRRTLTVTARDAASGAVLSAAHMQAAPISAFDGAVALVSHRGPEGAGLGYRFEDWQVIGDLVVGTPEYALGPVMFVHYTVDEEAGPGEGRLRMTAQAGPLGEGDTRVATLELADGRAGSARSPPPASRPRAAPSISRSRRWRRRGTSPSGCGTSRPAGTEGSPGGESAAVRGHHRRRAGGGRGDDRCAVLPEELHGWAQVERERPLVPARRRRAARRTTSRTCSTSPAIRSTRGPGRPRFARAPRRRRSATT